MRDQKEPYNLGDEEFHLALTADDFDKAHALHEKMGCICFENHDMGIYFINDPDGYWIEIIPAKQYIKGYPMFQAFYVLGIFIKRSKSKRLAGIQFPDHYLNLLLLL